MTIEIKQGTAVTFLLGPFVDIGDGVTAETGLATAMDNATTGIRVSKNGGNMADRNDATAPVHDEDGFYTIVLDATDTNTLGFLQVEYSEVATALPAWQDFSVVTANYWDTKYGADQFDVNVTNMAANSIATGVIATDAIGVLAMAPNSIAADVMAAGSIATGVMATDAIGTDAMAPNAIGTDVMAAGSITATVVATDAIDADALATDAVNEIARAIGIQKNTAYPNLPFIMFDSTDSKTPITGRTVSGFRSIDGGVTFNAVTGTPSETADGAYQLDASAADMDGDLIIFKFTATGADDAFVTVKTVA